MGARGLLRPASCSHRSRGGKGRRAAFKRGSPDRAPKLPEVFCRGMLATLCTLQAPQVSCAAAECTDASPDGSPFGCPCGPLGWLRRGSWESMWGGSPASWRSRKLMSAIVGRGLDGWGPFCRDPASRDKLVLEFRGNVQEWVSLWLGSSQLPRGNAGRPDLSFFACTLPACLHNIHFHPQWVYPAPTRQCCARELVQGCHCA